MKQQIKTRENDVKRMPMMFSIDITKQEFDEKGAPKEIQVLMCGKWNHPFYGPIVIEPQDISEFKENFDKKLRRDIPITEGHETMDEKPAVGWFAELIDKGTEGLWAVMDWTEKGKTLLSDRAYKYFSPEFYTEYEDPETREIFENVLVGGALTNKPYFKKMQAVVLSEHTIGNNYQIFNDMNLQEILAKKVEELSAEETAFLKEHKAELTEEQKTTFASVLEEKAAETEDEKKAREEKEAADAKAAEEKAAEEKAAADKAAEEAKAAEEKKASELKLNVKLITMSETEAAALREMADKGKKAFDELQKTKVENECKALTFSEQNSKGKFLPKSAVKLASFMSGLSEEQRKMFGELVSEIPAASLFNEEGSGNAGAVEGSAAAEISKRAEKLMSEDKTLEYSAAVRKVLASDATLSKQHQEETTPGKK